MKPKRAEAAITYACYKYIPWLGCLDFCSQLLCPTFNPQEYTSIFIDVVQEDVPVVYNIWCGVQNHNSDVK